MFIKNQKHTQGKKNCARGTVAENYGQKNKQAKITRRMEADVSDSRGTDAAESKNLSNSAEVELAEIEVNPWPYLGQLQKRQQCCYAV